MATAMTSQPQKTNDERPSFVISDFGESVGSSLNALEREFDDMILTFESPKTKLRNFSTSSTPRHQRPHSTSILDDHLPGTTTKPPLSPISPHVGPKTPGRAARTAAAIRSASFTLKRKWVKKTAGIRQRRRDSADSAHKRSSTSLDSVNSLASLDRVPPLHSNSNNSSVLELDDDAFHQNAWTQQPANNNNVFSTLRRKMRRKASATSCDNILAPARPSSTGSSGDDALPVPVASVAPAPAVTTPKQQRRGMERNGSLHVLTPAVKIDGRLTSDYRYLSLRRNVRLFSTDDVIEPKSLNLKLSEMWGRERAQAVAKSPLKSLYQATVLKHTTTAARAENEWLVNFNQHNNNNNSNSTRTGCAHFACHLQKRRRLEPVR